MITYIRQTWGHDDAVLYRILTDSITCNFDDEIYVLPRWGNSRFLHGVRRLIRSSAVENLNREILEKAEKFEDFNLFAYKGAFIAPDTVRFLQARGGRVVYYLPDLSVVSHRNNLAGALRYADKIYSQKATFNNDFPEYSARVEICTPVIARPSFSYKEVCLEEYAGIVGFLGHASPGKFEFMRQLVTNTAHLPISYEIIGSGWGDLASKSVKCLGELYGDIAKRRMVQWGVSLGLLMESHAGAKSADMVTSRSFIDASLGASVLHSSNQQYLDLFPDAFTFKDVTDAVAKIEIIMSMKMEERCAYRAKMLNDAANVANFADTFAEKLKIEFS